MEFEFEISQSGRVSHFQSAIQVAACYKELGSLGKGGGGRIALLQVRVAPPINRGSKEGPDTLDYSQARREDGSMDHDLRIFAG